MNCRCILQCNVAQNWDCMARGVFQAWVGAFLINSLWAAQISSIISALRVFCPGRLCFCASVSQNVWKMVWASGAGWSERKLLCCSLLARSKQVLWFLTLFCQQMKRNLICEMCLFSVWCQSINYRLFAVYSIYRVQICCQ